MSWIDYKKAYDMVPYSWIKEILHITGVAANIQNLLTNSMENWGTLSSSNGKELDKIVIKRVLFQGDPFSPLLFVMAMILLTMILRKVDAGYRFNRSREKVNHLLFMDDLKFYSRSKEELGMLVEMAKLFSDDVGTKFGLEKCFGCGKGS